MKHAKLVGLSIALLMTCGAVAASAQQPTPTPPPAAPLPYGGPMTLDQAKKAMAASEAEAKKNNWNVVIAIVDAGGNLMMLQRSDNTQFGSINVAKQKAHAAAAFRRPTKAFQDGIAQGGAGLRILNITGDAGVLEGGVPVIVGGRVIGAIGVSGVTSQQDAQIAQAGADSLK
jgi:uncharacterized protein GlcG (DUF336 family)